MAKSTIQPFIVSFGAESYFLDADIARARGWQDRSVVMLSGEDVTEAEVVSECETRGVDDRERVVILDDAQKVKEGKTLKAYIEDKAIGDSSVVLVVIVRAEKLPEIWNLAASKGRLLEHRKLKTFDTNNEVVKWISTEAMKRQIGLDKGIAEAIYQNVGSDLYRLNNELQKLQLFVGKGNKVKVEHLKLVLSPSPSAEPWQVAEAVVEKDAKKALNLLSVVYRMMGDEAHVPLCFSLIKQVEKLLVARCLMRKGASEEELAAAVGMHPWRCKTYFLPNAKKHSLDTLVSSMGKLRDLDVDVKSAARSKRSRVELAVLAITGG